MSNGKLFGVLSGAQVTAIALGAMLTPAGLYAAVTYSNVSIVNPTTGVSAFVDATRHLYTYDPIAGYTNNPANLVVLSGECAPNTTTNLFTVPTGKALILKAMQLGYFDGTANFKNYAQFFDNKTGIYLARFFDLAAVKTFQADFGSGFYIHENDGFSCQSSVTGSYAMYGYYVPATAVPPN